MSVSACSRVFRSSCSFFLCGIIGENSTESPPSWTTSRRYNNGGWTYTYYFTTKTLKFYFTAQKHNTPFRQGSPIEEGSI